MMGWMVVRTHGYAAPLPPRRRRGWIIGFIAVVAVVIAGLGVLIALWSKATLEGDSSALARIGLKPFAGSLVRATAFGPDGHPIPLAVSDGRVTPLEAVTPGERISLDVVIRRPGWLSWALGRYQVERLSVTAPVAAVTQRWLTVAAGAPPVVRFAQPVSAVSYTTPGQPAVSVRLAGRSRTITLHGLAGAGTAMVAAAARSWEKPSAPVAVSWFPASSTPVLVADPAPGARVSPLQPIRLTFSEPITTLMGSAVPSVAGSAHGTWRALDSHTLLYTPGGVGAPLGSELRFTLAHAVASSNAAGALSAAGDQLTWTVPVGSPMRLEQLLAQLGWLPLSWHPSGSPVAHTARAQAAAAVAPPSGSFSWRYPNTPAQLRRLWAPGPSQPDREGRGDVVRAHDTASASTASPGRWCGTPCSPTPSQATASRPPTATCTCASRNRSC